MGFARAHNRAQQVALDMRTDMTAYEYSPETISRLTPHPNYPERALPDKWHGVRRGEMARASLERLRTAAILKKENERRYNQGRVYAHVKLDQIKREVQKLRDHDTGVRRKRPVRVPR